MGGVWVASGSSSRKKRSLRPLDFTPAFGRAEASFRTPATQANMWRAFSPVIVEASFRTRRWPGLKPVLWCGLIQGPEGPCSLRLRCACLLRCWWRRGPRLIRRGAGHPAGRHSARAFSPLVADAALVPGRLGTCGRKVRAAGKERIFSGFFDYASRWRDALRSE